MKALLINPYVPLEVIYGKSIKDFGAVLPALGIFYLASYLKTKGKHEVEILDANALGMGPDAIIGHMKDKGIGCVGLTSTTLGYPYAIDVARSIRSAYPNVKIAIGGAHAQGTPDGIINDNPGLFDYVCYGEGEYAFESLMDHLDGAIEKDKLLGWKYLEAGQIVASPPAEIPENLDVFGHPSELLPPEWLPLYHEKILAYKELPMFSIMSSRGCPFQCTFCSTPRKFKELYHMRVRRHSIEWIKDELAVLEGKLGVREIIFVDDTFNLSKKRVMEFCEMKLRHSKITWSCNFEANIADEEMMHKMKQAGCWAIMVGGESGCERILEFIQKGVTVKQLELVGRLANEIGIVSRVSFILGFPTDTVESIEESVEFVSKSDFHFPYFQLYIPLPGTKMFDMLLSHGEISTSDPKRRSASNVNYLPKGVTAEYLREVYGRAFRKAYFRLRMLRNHLQFIRTWRDIRRYWRGIKVLRGF